MHVRVDDEARRVHEQRIAIRRRLRHGGRADDAVRPRLVLHHEGLAHLLLELGRDHAGDDVRAAGRRRNHDAHRPVRIVDLRPRGARDGERGKRCGPSARFHCILLSPGACSR